MSEKNKLPLGTRFRSFWAGIKKFFNVKKNKLRAFMKTKDFIIPFYGVLRILMNGIMFSLGLSYFIGFHWYMIFITGCGWFIIKEEVLPEVRQILGSFNLIRIAK